MSNHHTNVSYFHVGKNDSVKKAFSGIIAFAMLIQLASTAIVFPVTLFAHEGEVAITETQQTEVTATERDVVNGTQETTVESPNSMEENETVDNSTEQDGEHVDGAHEVVSGSYEESEENNGHEIDVLKEFVLNLNSNESAQTENNISKDDESEEQSAGTTTTDLHLYASSNRSSGERIHSASNYPSSGSVRVCKVIVGSDGKVAQNSATLPSGQFSVELSKDDSSVSHIANFSVDGFTPDSDIIAHDDVLDADCVTFTNLAFGEYTYSPEVVGGSDWNTPLYNDDGVNDIGDFYEYRSTNSHGCEDKVDGNIRISKYKPTATVVVLNRAKTVAVENKKPVISLSGEPVTQIVLGSTYIDLGATAHDDEDGDISATITSSSTVNANIAGTYTVTYNVKDSKGLAADPVVRTVNVVAEAGVKGINLVATAIKCANEADLPNWGLGGADITADTAREFLAAHPTCHPIDNWNFQWGDQNVTNPGDDYYWDAGVVTGWNMFGGTDENGVARTFVPLMPGTTKIKVREVLEAGYLAFSYGQNGNTNTDNYSAELYCANDVNNYDNFDFITEPISGNTYNCVAFNVKLGTTSPQNQKPVITLIGDSSVTIVISTTTPYLDLGASAQDPEDGDISANIVASSTVNSSVLGTYTVTYNVKDSKGLAADPVVRTVNVVAKAQCADGIDNDADGKIDFGADLGCDNANDTTENSAPIITVIGVDPLVVTQGTVFSDPGATAFDLEDGTITPMIIATGTVNTSIVGSYTISYDVKDSMGVSAVTKTRTVNVVSSGTGGGGGGGGSTGGSTPAQCSDGQDNDADGYADFPRDPGCTSSSDNDETDTPTTTTSGGGSGGGGGSISGGGSAGQTLLTITNEKLFDLSPTSVRITWDTNIAANSRIVYGPISNVATGTASQYGYMFTSATDFASTTQHSMVIDGLVPGINYYFRPVSQDANSTVIGLELKREMLPAACNYLKTYMRLGYANDADEVTKLQRFLKEYEGDQTVSVNGVFDLATDAAVRAFQLKYRVDVLDPWSLPDSTGYVYYTTQKKVNEIYCKRMFPLNDAQISEIDAFKDLIARLNATGTPANITIPVVGSVGTGGSNIAVVDPKGEVAGVNTETGTSEERMTNIEKITKTGRIALADLLATVPNVSSSLKKGTTTEGEIGTSSSIVVKESEGVIARSIANVSSALKSGLSGEKACGTASWLLPLITLLLLGLYLRLWIKYRKEAQGSPFPRK